MADRVTPQVRSRNMAAIKSKNMKPERVVRSAAHKLGLRFRLHRKDLPGKPDLVFPKWKVAVFVHGCFWHQHADENCKLSRMPKSNLDYWRPKLQRNVTRDAKNTETLQALGWRVITIWECETKDAAALNRRLRTIPKRAANHKSANDNNH